LRLSRCVVGAAVKNQNAEFHLAEAIRIAERTDSLDVFELRILRGRLHMVRAALSMDWDARVDAAVAGEDVRETTP
jgi:hypothetical protein